MFERFSRSWDLVQASAAVLRADRELLILPVVSGICTIIVSAAFLVPAFASGMIEAVIQAEDAGKTVPAMGYAWLFAFYLVQYFVILFFNTALVGAALIRLDGGNPTLGDAFHIALSRIGAIAGYAVISATVGLILRVIAERLGVIGRIVEGVLGLAWSVSTFLVIPILAVRGVGPVEAISQSASLLRKSWGENIIGSAGIGLVFGLIVLAITVVGFGATVALFDADAAAIAILIAALTVIAICAVLVFSAALGAVYSAAVYRFAEGKSTGAFNANLLADAFHARKR